MQIGCHLISYFAGPAFSMNVLICYAETVPCPGHCLPMGTIRLLAHRGSAQDVEFMGEILVAIRVQR